MPNFKTKFSLAKFLHDSVGGPTTYKGNPLSSGDQKTVTDTMKVWLALVWERCVDGDEARFGRWLQLVKSLHEADLFDLLSCLDFAAETLTLSVADSKLRSWSYFKGSVRAQLDAVVMPISLFIGLLKSRMLKWRYHSDVTAFAEMREVCCYPLRLNLKDQLSLAQAAYDKWQLSEDSFGQEYEYPGLEQELISNWFPDTIENRNFLAEHFVPHHGSGTTRESARSNGEKYMVSGMDENLYHLLGWLGDPDPLGINLMQKPFVRLTPLSIRRWTPVDGWNVEFSPCIPVPRHRIIGVPKNWKTERLVSEEPAAYMFYQLGLNNFIQDYLKDKDRAPKQLVRGYCVDTEGRNRSMAQLGSVDGSFVTIDLSAASDSVSEALVRQFFHGSLLAVPLERLRTRYAEFDLELPDFWGRERVRDVRRIDKYAPMGSGICFSVECIVFSAIVVASILLTPGADRRWAVYGDDIVVHISVARKVIARLTQYGFTVNLSKTFTNSRDESPDFFRESCGGEYLNGIDVTPHRIPRKFSGFPAKDSWQEASTSIAQAIQLANDLFDRPAARAVVLYPLLSEDIPVYFDEDGTSGIRSVNPTNYHLKKRFNKQLQRWEVRAFKLRTERKNPLWRSSERGWAAEDAFFGEVALFDYLAAAARCNRQTLLFPEDGVNVRMDPFSTVVKAVCSWADMPIPPFSSCVRLRTKEKV